MDSLIQIIAVAALPVIFAITLHEAAHGYAARFFGDRTAEREGRISLNPLRHIDPVGTVLVPVDFSRLRRPKQDMLWVAAAGPGANLFMALAWGLLFKLAQVLPDTAYTLPMLKMADIGMDINMALMLLNLLPLPPLDGGRILVSLLPIRQAIAFSRIEPWGFPLLLLLLFTGVLSAVLNPLMGLMRLLLALLFNFHA